MDHMLVSVVVEEVFIILVSIITGVAGLYLGNKLKALEKELHIVRTTVTEHEYSIKALRADVGSLLKEQK